MRRLLFALGFALFGGCAREATVLIVLVDTDLSVPRELDAVKATVESETGHPLAHSEFLLTDSSSVSALADERSSVRTITKIPFSFGVSPIDADPSRVVRVELTASIRLDGGPSMVRRSASTAFGDRQTLALPLWLERACAGVTCADEDTCIAGTCTPDRIDAADLLEITPGKEFDGLPGP